MNQTRRLIAFMLTVFMLSSLFILPVEVHAAYPPIEDRPQESGSDDNGNGRYDIINTRNVTGEDIINEAKTWLGQGATYWSGTSPWPDCVTWRMGFPKSDGSIHFDCSGFVSRVLNDCGLRCDEWHCNYGSSLLTERYGDNYLSTNLNYQRLYGIDIDAEVQRAKNGDWSGMVPGDIITFVSSNNHVLFYAGQNENGQPMTIEVYGNGNYDCVRYGVCFSNYPQYFEHGARLVVPGYLANCTPYPSYCTLRITDSTCKIKSLPCSVNTDPSSSTVEVPSVGDTYTAVRLYKNTAGNYWYQVNCKNGKTGYLYADDCAYVSSSFSDVSGSNINVPTSLTVGSSFPVRGTVSTNYNNISKVSVYIYPGSATSGTAETGDEESVDTQSYNLQRLDNNVVFGVLPVGTHNYVVKATTYGYYATGPKTATTKSSTTIVKQQTFSVVSGSQPDPSNEPGKPSLKNFARSYAHGAIAPPINS